MLNSNKAMNRYARQSFFRKGSCNNYSCFLGLPDLYTPSLFRVFSQNLFLATPYGHSQVLNKLSLHSNLHLDSCSTSYIQLGFKYEVVFPSEFDLVALTNVSKSVARCGVYVEGVRCSQRLNFLITARFFNARFLPCDQLVSI